METIIQFCPEEELFHHEFLRLQIHLFPGFDGFGCLRQVLGSDCVQGVSLGSISSSDITDFRWFVVVRISDLKKFFHRFLWTIWRGCFKTPTATSGVYSLHATLQREAAGAREDGLHQTSRSPDGSSGDSSCTGNGWQRQLDKKRCWKSHQCPAWNDTPTSTYINGIWYYMILYDIIWYYMIPHVQKSIMTYSVYG